MTLLNRIEITRLLKHHSPQQIVFKENICMGKYNEDTIESFIRENKDKFSGHRPQDAHMEKFLRKINFRIRHIISIVPYLIKVSIATIFIFTFSIIIWNDFIRKDRHVITLNNKISIIIHRIESK